MKKHPPFDAKRDRSELARKVLQTLSVDLQSSLAQRLATGDRLRFGRALNSLKLDDATRNALILNVKREMPALKQPELLTRRCFRRQVNSLRCLGESATLSVLDEVLPGTSRAALVARSTMGGAAESRAKPHEPLVESSLARSVDSLEVATSSVSPPAPTTNTAEGGAAESRPEESSTHPPLPDSSFAPCGSVPTESIVTLANTRRKRSREDSAERSRD